MTGPAAGRVFGVGFHRTGTSTLRECYRILGLKESGFDLELTRNLILAGRMDPILEHAQHCEAFHDWPWPLCFRALADAFPTSRFVLTTRQSSMKWHASLMKHYAWVREGGDNRSPEVFALLYGPGFPANRDACIARYERHNRNVRDFFRGTGRLLEVCWENGDGWSELCGFLGVPRPDGPFPHISCYAAAQGSASNPS